MEYAFVSHESAIEANWAIARLGDFTPLDDEGIWMIPAPEHCVTNIKGLRALMAARDLDKLGIVRRPIDLLVPTASSRSRGRLASFHVWGDAFPKDAFIRVDEQVFVSSPLFTILQLALAPRPSRLSRESARQLAEENECITGKVSTGKDSLSEENLLAWKGIACEARAIQVLTDFLGTYQLPVRPKEEVIYGTSPLLKLASLEAFLDAHPRMRGVEKGREACRLALADSGSPMETTVALLLTLPVEMGGYGLPRPTLNWQVPIEGLGRVLVSQEEILGDLCWREQGLVVEYDSWERHGSKGKAKLAHDRARANSLTALGWNVLTVDYRQISSVQGMTLLARQVAKLLGCTLDEPTDLQEIWRGRLHTLLMPADTRWL